MNISDSLYEGELVHLAAPEPDRDAEIESRWTHDPEYLRLLDAEPVQPLAPIQIKKRYEAEWKEDGTFRFHIAIRTRADDRLVGFVKFHHVEWTNGTVNITMGIGDPSDRRRGYGTEALQLILRYAFDELNLYRLSAAISEYNQAALRLFEQAGFTVEVRRRQAIHRDGRRWDALILGLLHEEWSVKRGG